MLKVGSFIFSKPVVKTCFQGGGVPEHSRTIKRCGQMGGFSRILKSCSPGGLWDSGHPLFLSLLLSRCEINSFTLLHTVHHCHLASSTINLKAMDSLDYRQEYLKYRSLHVDYSSYLF